MNCLRCQAPMFREIYDDLLETQGQRFGAMHCVMCGDIVDPVILRNRQNPGQPQASGARQRLPVAA